MIVRPADLTIVGGVFNCVMHSLVDKQPHSSLSLTTQARSLQNMCQDLGFVDVWRSLHPADKEYTFFSTCYHCQSRLDYFFYPKNRFAFSIILYYTKYFTVRSYQCHYGASI